MANVAEWDAAQNAEAGQIDPQNLYKSNPLIQKQQSAFTQMFQNLLGRAPSSEELNNFVQNTYVGQTHPDLIDPYQAAQSYVQTAFGPEAAKYSQTQQANQLTSNQGMIQDLINKTMGNTAAQFSDPNSQLYRSFSGAENNMGITPSSGAFQAGAGSTIADAGLQAANQGLSAVTIPGVQQIGQTGQNPYQMSLGGPAGLQSQVGGLNNFQMQADLAQLMNSQSASSPLQSAMGLAGGASSAFGNAAQGASALKGMNTSYVCLELIKRGLLCESDMDDFHVHIMPAMFKKARAFWKYAMDGKNLVDAVNAKGLDWKSFKPLLFDRVMDEPDPCKAVDLYADACHQLCIASDRSLWDGRVFRTSSFDSLPFLPFLFLYKPFREALWKCIRIKMMILYDHPRCEVHR